MVEDEDPNIASYYGVWPTVLGLAFGIGLTVFMFMLADGFTG